MLKMKTTLLSIAVLATLALPALAHEDHQESAFESITEAYLSIQTSLATDSLEGVKDNATAIAKKAKGLGVEFDLHEAGVAKKDAKSCRKLMPELAANAKTLAGAKDIKAARKAFAPLSENMVTYRNMIPGDEKPNVAYCPMVKHNWLQNGKKINNPYFGAKMLRCGKIVNK